jgi:hypothetical protein
MFLDDTACNLASLNLMAFRKDVIVVDAENNVTREGTPKAFDVEGFEHAVRCGRSCSKSP